MPPSLPFLFVASGLGEESGWRSTLFCHTLHLSSCLLKWQVFHITKAPLTAKFILQWEPIWVRRQKEGRFWQKEQVKERLKMAIYRCWVRETRGQG